MDKNKYIKLIPAQPGNRITDMGECTERILSVDYWPSKKDMLQ